MKYSKLQNSESWGRFWCSFQKDVTLALHSNVSFVTRDKKNCFQNGNSITRRIIGKLNRNK